jgi:hypothetical protein
MKVAKSAAGIMNRKSTKLISGNVNKFPETFYYFLLYHIIYKLACSWPHPRSVGLVSGLISPAPGLVKPSLRLIPPAPGIV